MCSALPRIPEYMNTLLSFKRNKHAIIRRVAIKERSKPSQTAIHTPPLCVTESTHGETNHHLLLQPFPSIIPCYKQHVSSPVNKPVIDHFAIICVLTSFLLQIEWAQFS